MLCTVSALLLPVLVSGQSIRAGRVAYGSPYPDFSNSWISVDTFSSRIMLMYGVPVPGPVFNVSDFPSMTEQEPAVPLLEVDGNEWIVSRDRMESFDWNNDYGNFEKLAALLGIRKRQIKCVNVLKDADATALWGAKGWNGVLQVTTKRARYRKGQPAGK